MIARDRLMLVALTFTLAAATAAAQSFPTKPVHILVPYAAGGAVDVLARTIGQALVKTWGQQPVIDNRPGAGGIIASQALIAAPPDGYTLMLVASGHPLNQFFYRKLPYERSRISRQSAKSRMRRLPSSWQRTVRPVRCRSS